jgi:hypothetical protein
MKKAVLGTFSMLLFTGLALAETPERWLHVRVIETGKEGETVRVNVPMSVAEQVLPAIKTRDLHEGKVAIHGKIEEVDLRAILNAVRNSPDNEFVTVEKADENVRVAKSGNFLLIKVREIHGKAEIVEVKLPIPVVDAMLSAGDDELDILAGLRALKAYGDIDLVSVKDGTESVRIWIDSRNSTE